MDPCAAETVCLPAVFMPSSCSHHQGTPQTSPSHPRGTSVLRDLRSFCFDQQYGMERKMLPGLASRARAVGPPLLHPQAPQERGPLHVLSPRGHPDALSCTQQPSQGPWDRPWLFLTRPRHLVSFLARPPHPCPDADFPGEGRGKRPVGPHSCLVAGACVCAERPLQAPPTLQPRLCSGSQAGGEGPQLRTQLS